MARRKTRKKKNSGVAEVVGGTIAGAGLAYVATNHVAPLVTKNQMIAQIGPAALGAGILFGMPKAGALTQSIGAGMIAHAAVAYGITLIKGSGGAGGPAPSAGAAGLGRINSAAYANMLMAANQGAQNPTHLAGNVAKEQGHGLAGFDDRRVDYGNGY